MLLTTDVDVERGAQGGARRFDITHRDGMAKGRRKRAAGHDADLFLSAQEPAIFARDASSLQLQADADSLLAVLSESFDCRFAYELTIAQRDGKVELSLNRVDRLQELVTVERHASLQTQCVASGQPDGSSADLFGGGMQLLPNADDFIGVADNFAAIFAGVASAADKTFDVGDRHELGRCSSASK